MSRHSHRPSSRMPLAARAAMILLLASAILAGEPAETKAVITTSLGAITVRLFPTEAPEAVKTFLDLAEGRREWTDPVSGAKVAKPFYDGLVFHRVIKDFMIQGGCPKGDGTSGPGFQFADEINARSLGLEQMTCLLGNDLRPECNYQMADFARLYVHPKMREKGIGPGTPVAEQQRALATILPALAGVTLRQFYESLGYRYRDDLPASHRPVRGSLALANSGPATNGSQFFINLGDTPHLAGKHTVFGEVVDGMAVVDAIGQVPTGPASRPLQAVVIVSIRAAP